MLSRKSLLPFFLTTSLVMILLGAAMLHWKKSVLKGSSELGSYPDTRKLPAEGTVPSLPTPSASPTPAGLITDKVRLECTGDEWLFTQEDSIYYFCSSNNQKIKIAQDGSNYGTRYGHFNFVTGSTISYSVCQPKAEFDQEDIPTAFDPYSCSLIVHDLSAGKKETLISFDSRPNVSGSEIGAEFDLVGWSNDKNHVAFTTVFYPNANGASAETRLYYVNVKTKQASVLATFPPPDGRGVGDNDEVKLVFSPDDQYILTQTFSRYTTEVDGETNYYEPVLLGITSVNNKVQPWSNQGKFTTFSSFIGSDKVIAKEFSAITPRDIRPELVVIQADTKEKTTVTEVSDWYDITLMGNDTLVFNTIDSYDKDIELITYSLRDKQPKQTWKNYYFIKKIDDQRVLVRKYKPCIPQNGCDPEDPSYYYPYPVLGEYVIFNIQTGELSPVAFSSDSVGIRSIRTN